MNSSIKPAPKSKVTPAPVDRVNSLRLGHIFSRTRETKESILRDSAPNFWACECGQMNLRDAWYCCTCGGYREGNWEENDREAALRQEQWHAN